MAKISQLPLLADPVGTEAVVVLDGDTTRRARIDQIAEAAVAPQVARAEAAADAADTTVAAVRPALSQPCAAIVGADANRWRMSFPDGQNVLADQGIYRFPAPSTPTGPITIEVIGGPVVDLRYDNGARVGAEAGITAPWEVAIRWDLTGGANIFRLQSSAYNLPRLAEALTIGDATKGLRDLTANPWGTFPNNGARVPLDVVFTGCGSSVFTDSAASVGRQGGAPEGQPPLAVLCGMVNARWPGGGVRSMPDDRSHGGHVLGQFLDQLAESPAWNAGSTRFVLVGAGMNDWQVSQFDTNQSFPNARAHTIALIEAAKAKSAKVLLCTSMHPQTQIYDYAGFFRTNTGFPASYPRDVAAPVDPETGQFPPASASVAPRDMTGGGVASPCDLRFWAGNRMLREVARLYPHDVVLLDIEWAWFRYGVEVHGVAALYDAGQFVHPNLLGHQVSIHRVLREFADDLTAGRPLRPLYRGDLIA